MLSKSQAMTLSRLFQPSVMDDLIKYGSSATFGRLIRASNIASLQLAGISIGDAFDAAFRELSLSEVRGDYVYRSAIMLKILMGKHSLRTATALNEVRVEASKADVVVLNGTSTAYEIKSERDSLARLATQIQDYRRTFANVVVLTSEKQVDRVASIVPEEVGLFILSRRFRIQAIRPAVSKPEILDPISISNMLRVEEAAQVLHDMGIELPDVPNTRMRTALQAIYSQQDPIAVHDSMVRVVRNNRTQSELSDVISALPTSLRPAAVASKRGPAEICQLAEVMDTPMGDALAWK